VPAPGWWGGGEGGRGRSAVKSACWCCGPCWSAAIGTCREPASRRPHALTLNPKTRAHAGNQPPAVTRDAVVLAVLPVLWGCGCDPAMRRAACALERIARHRARPPGHWGLSAGRRPSPRTNACCRHALQSRAVPAPAAPTALPASAAGTPPAAIRSSRAPRVACALDPRPLRARAPRQLRHAQVTARTGSALWLLAALGTVRAGGGVGCGRTGQLGHAGAQGS
jgi:hypothetical protein